LSMRRRHFGREKTRTRKLQLRKIQRALNAEPACDVGALRSVSSKGFLNNHLRRRAWAALLGMSASALNEPVELRSDYKHAYSEQIEKDVPRSMHQHDATRSLDAKERDDLRGALARILHTMFAKNPELHYIQGYHDICTVVLLVFYDEAQAYQVMRRLSWLHIRDALRDSLSSVVAALDLIFVLLGRVDPEVAQFLAKANVRSFCTLSWVLTWFSHDLEAIEDVSRIFDFLLASHPSMALYLAVAFILSLKPKIMLLSCDDGSVHNLFQRLPKVEDVESLLLDAEGLFERYPLAQLIEWHRQGDGREHASAMKGGQELSQLAEDSPLHAYSIDDLVASDGKVRPGGRAHRSTTTKAETRAKQRRRAFVAALATGIVAIGSSALLHYLEVEIF
jgi:hypothetical protein